MTRAVLLADYGPPDGLQLGEAEIAKPGPGQIRVAVRYAGVGPTDLAIRAGHLSAVFPAGPGAVLGFEAAGVVERIGEDVPDVAVGNEVAVFLPRLGGYADLVVADFWVRKSASVSWTDAAAFPASGEAAVRVLDQLAVACGETVLLLGAAGSVNGSPSARPRAHGFSGPCRHKAVAPRARAENGPTIPPKGSPEKNSWNFRRSGDRPSCSNRRVLFGGLSWSVSEVAGGIALSADRWSPMIRVMNGVVDLYTAGDEDIRMTLDRNELEWIRTCELLTRWLPPPPATVVDAGGGPGRQARHLLDHGYDVTLYDLVPKHVQ